MHSIRIFSTEHQSASANTQPSIEVLSDLCFKAIPQKSKLADE